MTLSGVLGLSILISLLFASVGMSLAQQMDISAPLTKFEDRQNSNSKSKDPHPKGNEFGREVPDTGAIAPQSLLPETRAVKKPKKLAEKIIQWKLAVEQHRPGEPDASAVKIGSWPAKDLSVVIDFIVKLDPLSVESARRAISKASIPDLLLLTDQKAYERDLYRTLKQGTLLHTDIALQELETGNYGQVDERMGLFVDGRIVLYPKTPHWRIARQLMDLILLLPSQNLFVKQWYIATTAHMQRRRLPGYAGQNLGRALEIFPRDPVILFYAGALHEAWASPFNQNVLLPPEAKVLYGSKESELKIAGQFYQKAIAESPDFAQAHLRLGRVSGLLGNHGRAVSELRLAVSSMNDPQLLYYAALYLGHELAILSRRNEAREQFNRAAALFPAAQSPLLALSQLSHSGHDADGALHALQRVFALPRKDFWKDDPMWTYDQSHVRNATALVEEMHKMFAELP